MDKLIQNNLNFKIETRSTYLLPISSNEITSKYVNWLNDNSINEFLEVRHQKQTEDSVINYINSLRRNNSCEMFAIFSKKDLRHIGNLTITSFNNHNNSAADFGIMIADELARSKGIGAEIHVAFLEFIFSFGSINRVNGNAASDNNIACKTLESLGYTKEGVRRNLFPLINGGVCDLNLYGYLKHEWEERKNKLSFLVDKIKITNI